MESFQKSQTSNIINLLMQMLQNQQQQMNQIMVTFMNFTYTSSPILTPLLTAIITQTASANDDFLYIKFPDLPLFNDDCNEYLVWKWKTFDKLLTEDQKYIKMGIQADYLWQHYINSCLNNSTAVKMLPWLNLNSNASMEEFWAFMDSQFKDNQLAEQALSKLSFLKQRGEVWTYVQEFNQLIIKMNLVSLSMFRMFDVHFDMKQILFNRNLKNEIWIHVLLVLRSTLFDEYIK